jgi:hypothetical protein
MVKGEDLVDLAGRQGANLLTVRLASTEHLMRPFFHRVTHLQSINVLDIRFGIVFANF